MNYGHLSITKAISNGFGSHQMLKLEKLSEFTLALEMRTLLENYGIHYPQFIVSVQLLTLIFGHLMVPFFLVNVVELQEKKQVRLAILKDLTILFDKEFLVQLGRLCLFLNLWKIILALSGILFTITMDHYLFSTTNAR